MTTKTPNATTTSYHKGWLEYRMKELDCESRLYVAGPMTGVHVHNYPLFNEVTEILRSYCMVFNPAENAAGERGFPREFYVRLDLGILLQCTGIVLLPDWEESPGASLEATVASELAMDIFRWGDDGKLYLRTSYKPYQFTIKE